MRPDPRLTPAAPGTVLPRDTGKVNALAVRMVNPNLDGGWGVCFFLIGDVLVTGGGSLVGDVKYNVDCYPAEEAQDLLVKYVSDDEAEGFALVGEPVDCTVSQDVYETVRDMNDHRGPSPLLDQLFDVAARMVTHT